MAFSISERIIRMKEIQEKLFELQDIKYKEFQSRLIPTVDPESIIGVRTPQLRKLAKELARIQKIEDFWRELPHTYYEENCLHAFTVETIRDYETCISCVEQFLPYIDNWAVCDQFSPRVFAKNREKLLERIQVWLRAEHTYTVRYAVDMLMRWYLDESFSEEHLRMAAAVRFDDYYVKMALAWYFATALAKQYDSTILYFEEGQLDVWVHNKAIQKAIESRRVSEERKAYLRGLKRKL